MILIGPLQKSAAGVWNKSYCVGFAAVLADIDHTCCEAGEPASQYLFSLRLGTCNENVDDSAGARFPTWQRHRVKGPDESTNEVARFSV